MAMTPLTLTGDAAFQQAVSALSAAQAQLSAAQASGNQAAAAQAQQAIYELTNTINQRLGVLGGDQPVLGKVLVQNAGEVAIPLTFPVVFVEEPFFTFGGVMDQGQAPVLTNFPTVSAVVLRWSITKFGSVLTYTGATLGVVTTGAKDHRMYVHWRFEGRAVAKDAGQGGGVT